jgi:hypothetical protein
MTATDHWGELDGVSIGFPIVVEELRSATLTWTVPAAAVAEVPGVRRVAGDDLVVAADGERATLVLSLCDYLRNPWGDYLEVNVGVLAHPVDDPARVGALVWRMPVDQEFTCRAGNVVLGLPKTVEDLALDEGPDTLAWVLRRNGEVELRVEVDTPPSAGEPVAADAITWSRLDGRLVALPLTIDLPVTTLDPAGVRVELGAGPLADELRSLDLPAEPDLAVWGTGLTGTFRRPVPVGD